ncbi:chorismate mutase [Candidatus Pacearchaeota archaeon]|nr:chorismate mutase [Candidatus Pacearchaeota archaeon]
MNEKIKEMQSYRRKIDQTDNKILELLNKRDKLVLEVGKIKKDNKLNITDKKREKEVFGSLKRKANELKLDKKFVAGLFRLIIKQSAKRQEQKIR